MTGSKLSCDLKSNTKVTCVVDVRYSIQNNSSNERRMRAWGMGHGHGAWGQGHGVVMGVGQGLLKFLQKRPVPPARNVKKKRKSHACMHEVNRLVLRSTTS